MLLLPVRLETRFFTQPDRSSELRVRIYPDKIHLDSHETALLPAERDWAQHYWTLLWRSGGDARVDAEAWRQLAERYGDARALWLRRVQTPSNLAQRPATPSAPEAALEPPPLFPAVELDSTPDAGAWRHAPLARLLPERWIAVASSGTRILAAAAGRSIVQPLTVGPDPGAAAPAELPGDQLAIDEAMRWMVDFAAAEEKGMALRLSIAAADLAGGIDRLVVLGTAAALAPEEAAKQLDALLDAHRYTDGLAFARLGTPTNNTAGQRSGFSDANAPQRARADFETAATTAADVASNARRFALALGLPPESLETGLATTTGAADSHERDARSMNAALWPATWGYFLTNLVGPGTPVSLAMLDWARERFALHVRAQGAFAPLRCGRQPYGILPVTSLDLWQPDTPTVPPAPPGGIALPPITNFDAPLRQFLLRLRDNVWRPCLTQVPRIGRGNPDEDLADVMRADAFSNHYETRALLGRHYLDHLRLFIGESLVVSGFNAMAETLAVGLLQRMGIAWRPRLFRMVYGDAAFPLTRELVQVGEVSAERLLEPNYIRALQEATSLEAVERPGGQPLPADAPLLQVLLRHALLRAYADAAARLLALEQGDDALALMREPELIDLVPDAPATSTWRRQLDASITTPAGPRVVREHLLALSDFAPTELRALGEMRTALAHLAGVDSERLLMLLQGTLDLSSHRLDAWISSFATRRLAEQRAAQPQGLYVGGYGWVEKLRPLPRPATPVTPLPADEPGPLLAPADDSGFIHAPSLTQAATAALLRNAHLGHEGRALADGPFAIDLSSARLRDARWLLDGIRQGQPLGALLGYRLERRLHELGFDAYIAPLREIAPLNAGKLVPSPGPLEAIAAQNVVDGLALWNRWKDARGGLFNGRPLPQPGAPDFDALARELDALGEAIDATGDAVTAEAAYQLVRGNVTRTASTLAAVAGGEAPVPELEVARTPRSGTAITHRVLLALNGRAATTPGWATFGTSQRARAEPVLNAWCARLLGDPRQVTITIQQLDDAGIAVTATHTLTLAELALTPLDLVHTVDPDARPGTLGELELRLLYHLRRKAALGPAVRLRIVSARAPDGDGKVLSLDDVIDQAAALRRLLAVGRPLEAEDLAPAQDEIAPAIDLAELGSRCSRAESALRGTHRALLRLLKPPADTPPATAEEWRSALFALLGFGFAGALPVNASGDDAATRGALAAQAAALLKDSQARLDRGAALAALPLASSPDKQRDALLERLRAVFGGGFVALPKFRCGNGAAFDAARAASTTLQGGDALAVHSWFDRIERVREAPARFGAALRGAEVLGTGAALRLAVAQLPLPADPSAAPPRWVALPPLPGEVVPPGQLSLVLHVGGAVPRGQTMATLDTTQTICGLLVDEWVEMVPGASETTALAFQFNPPDACAPQALLLAVPPVVGQPWTVARLHQVLTETMDLAQLRGVDAEALGELGHYLPALHLALNHDGDAVSTPLG
ncbi:hypothetical protein [Niveibacterium sp. SC-1]|uniref:hypothetical protein n=1 Tax=Niveibacterium sp. SC-1 TaxID=3135646 RepID=UPI00311E7DE3